MFLRSAYCNLINSCCVYLDPHTEICIVSLHYARMSMADRNLRWKIPYCTEDIQESDIQRERVRECWYPFDQISYMRRINMLDINKNKKICDERAATERVLLSSTKENIRRNMRVASTVRIWLRCKNMKSINEVFSLQIFFIL